MFYDNFEKLVWELSQKHLQGMTFWECFEEKEFGEKLWKLCLMANICVRKDYMKN